MLKQTKENRHQYFLIIAWFVFTLVTILYGQHLDPGNSNIRRMDYSQLLIILPGLLMLMPWDINPLQHQVPTLRIQCWFPALLGVAFGIADMVIIEGFINEEPHQQLPPYTQPFPYSVFLYYSGGFEIEIWYRLIPITITLLLFSKISNRRFSNFAFWCVAVISSLVEPLMQFVDQPVWFAIYAMVSGFGMNFLEAITLRNSGFWSALNIRLGHYLIWHILNGIIIQASL